MIFCSVLLHFHMSDPVCVQYSTWDLGILRKVLIIIRLPVLRRIILYFLIGDRVIFYFIRFERNESSDYLFITQAAAKLLEKWAHYGRHVFFMNDGKLFMITSLERRINMRLSAGVPRYFLRIR